MRQSTSAPPYAVKTATLAAAGGVEVFSGEWEFFSVISATAPDKLEISINNQGFQPYVYGSTLFGLKAYAVNSIILRNTDVGANTVTVAEGGANYQQANSSALAPGAATAANQALEIAQLTTINTNLGGNLKVQGVAADGAAVSGNPVLMGGQDGTNAQSIKVDTTGRQEVIGGAAIGAAAVGNPVLAGFRDGSGNVQAPRCDTSGNLQVIGTVAAGSAIGTTAPVMQGVSDGTNVQRMKGSTTGAAMVTGEAAHSAASVGNPVRVGGRVATAVDTTLVAGDAADLQATSGGAATVYPFAVPEVSWQYAAAAAGILNTTTAVTIKAAAAAGVRNYIASMDVQWEALTNATEFAVRDGASGTVIHRFKIPSGSAGNRTFEFAVPLRGTAATLLEVVTLTASGAGAVYVNAQGFTAP